MLLLYFIPQGNLYMPLAMHCEIYEAFKSFNLLNKAVKSRNSASVVISRIAGRLQYY